METIYPSAIRKVKGVDYQRERIITPDDDFLDIDWVKNGNKRLVLISHGLEGSSHRPYVQGVAKLFANNNWDVLAWNCRSCSGEMNKTKILYHHGFTEDVDTVVKKAISEGYEEICMIGFSMGGSLTLKYIGEKGEHLPYQIKKGMGVSVPCDLGASSKKLSEKGNAFYKNRFMRKLTVKMKEKNEQFPGSIEVIPYKSIPDFHTFDTHYSAKMFGFKDGADFYANVQCLPYLKDITIPTLLLNAKNDPMLTDSCFPYEVAENHAFFSIEATKYGGHVGYTQKGKEHTYAEERALKFFEEAL